MPAERAWRIERRLGTSCFIVFGFFAAVHGGEAATVKLRADVILASNQGTGTDERLGQLGKQLSESPIKYSRYELLASPGGQTEVSQTWRAALPGGRTLEVTPTAVVEGMYHVQVRLLGPKGEQIMGTNLKLPPGRPGIIAGPPHAPGVLFIALSAS